MSLEVTRPCGLYRTDTALASNPDSVGSNLLVMFHNHSDQGPPLVLLPDQNHGNRWSFHKRGFHVEDGGFIESMAALKSEGLYRLREHFHPDAGRVVAVNTLVQLGYNRQAEPIVFFPVEDRAANALSFPSKGMKVPPAVYALLEPLDLRGPFVQRHLH